jgi:hypothetical protein
MQRAQSAVSIAHGATNFVMTWNERDGDASTFNWARLSPDLQRLDTRHTEAGEFSAAKAIAFDGTDFMIGSDSANGIVLRRFAGDGVTPTAPPLIVPRGSLGGIAAGGGSFVAVSNYGGQIVATFIGRDNAVSTPVILSPALTVNDPVANNQNAVIAFDGAKFLVTWGVAYGMSDPGPPIPDTIAAVLVSTDGRVIGSPFVLARKTRFAAVASNGHGFLVALEKWNGDVATVPVTDDGIVGAEQLVFEWRVAYQWSDLDITASGDDYIVTERYGVEPAWRLATIRVDADGHLKDIRSVAIGTPGSALAIASDGSGGTLVLNSDFATPAESERIRAYSPADFSPLPAAPVAPQNVSAIRASAPYVTWTSTDPTVFGFAIESTFLGDIVTLAIVPADARAALAGGPYETTVRVRALGPGGLSAPSEFVPVRKQPRRRAAQ